MKTINAVFNGKNGSLGFEHGVRYDLEMYQSNGSPEVTIYRVSDNQKSVYSNLSAFLDNWKDVSAVARRGKATEIIKEAHKELQKLYELYGHESTGRVIEKLENEPL